MRPLVGLLVSGSRAGPPRKRRARRRRRAGIAYGVAVLVAVSLLAARAAADRGYQLEFGFAKRALARETAAFCGSIPSCADWSVRPCRRQSWHRVDCLSHLYGENGSACGFVGIAVWPPWSDQLIVHRKRIVCAPAGGSE